MISLCLYVLCERDRVLKRRRMIEGDSAKVKKDVYIGKKRREKEPEFWRHEWLT